MSVLTDEIEDLIDDEEDAEGEVGNSPGPLPEPQLTAVRLKLNSAQTHASNVLFLVANVGTADQNNLPGTLPAIATECVTLAQAALTEANRPTPNNAVIGSKMKTINRILDVTNGYRDRAGIT